MADITKTTEDGETMMMIMVKTKVTTKITKRKNSFIVTARSKKAGNFPRFFLDYSLSILPKTFCANTLRASFSVIPF